MAKQLTRRMVVVVATIAGLFALTLVVAAPSDATDPIGNVCPLGTIDANDPTQCAYTVVQFIPGVYTPAAGPVEAQCPDGTDALIVVGERCKELGAVAEMLPCTAGQIEVTIVIPAEDRTEVVCFDSLPKLDALPAMAPMCNEVAFDGAPETCGTNTQRNVVFPALPATATCPQGGTNTDDAAICSLAIPAIFVSGLHVAATDTAPASCNDVPTSITDPTECLIIISPEISLNYTALPKAVCGGQPANVNLGLGQVPTDGPDVIVGTFGDDVIVAMGGDDVICGRGGNDTIWGQDGNDTIYGEDGDDKLRGGDGFDTLMGGEGADDLAGGRDNDRVFGEGGNDVALRGGTGSDIVDGGLGDETLIAGNGGSDTVRGGAGNDALVTGGPRPDLVDGGDGDDVIKGNGGADVLSGGAGDDDLRGGPQADELNGGFGTDSCNGGTTPSAIFEADSATNCETITNVP